MNNNTEIKQNLIKLAYDNYGSSPEYLWESDPDSFVLRRSDTKKWFAAFMRVSFEKIGAEGKGIVEILDVKCSPLMVGSMIQKKGYFPGYHMNKNNWITVLLDGTVDFDEIAMLLDESYELVGKKSTPKKKANKDNV